MPSKPGGGFDVTCKLARDGLQNLYAAGAAPLRISYLPGGIGAVAWNSILSKRPAEADTLVAFSGGSLLNLALGKFGKSAAADMRWVAALGVDYGMIAVRADSPFHSLDDLMKGLQVNPAAITIGSGGTIGSQDWIKIMLLARQRNVEAKKLRFVAFEGGGEAFTALSAGHVQVVSGDASEALLHASGTDIRVLAVFSDNRLAGKLAAVPTAREQGFDFSWPIVRGLYVGPKVSQADYQRWVTTFDRVLAQPGFDRLRTATGLHPVAPAPLTGAALTAYVKSTVDAYGRQARTLGLIQ